MNHKLSTLAQSLPAEYLTKQEIAMNLATEGFRFLAYEPRWNQTQPHELLQQLGDIESRLSDEDCREFAEGLQQCLHDSAALYQYVTEYTHKLLDKWGLSYDFQTPSAPHDDS